MVIGVHIAGPGLSHWRAVWLLTFVAPGVSCSLLQHMISSTDGCVYVCMPLQHIFGSTGACVYVYMYVWDLPCD